MPELTIDVEGHAVKIDVNKTWGKVTITADGKTLKESRIIFVGEKDYTVLYNGHEVKFVVKIPVFGAFRKWEILGYVDGKLRGTT